MRSYTLRSPHTREGILEFARVPQWEEVLDALMIRGNLIGLRRDIFEAYYVCQGSSGALHVMLRLPGYPERLAYRLEPRSA